MNHTATVQASFERNKNLQALAVTIAVAALLFLVFFLLRWSLPHEPQPVLDEGIEINLGNSETGLGNIAPQITGTPTDAAEASTPMPTAAQTNTQPQNIATDENETDEVAAISKPTKVVEKPKPNDNEKPIAKKVAPVVASHNTLTAAAPKPKALFKVPGSTGIGGNYADSYNGVKNQGIAGGIGDQGKPNGNPNSDSYNGNGGTGKSGVKISKGLKGRRFTKFPSFEDDFNENAKVFVDITVDKGGKVITAAINNSGTTTPNKSIRNIALRKAKELTLNAYNDEEQTGTIVFNFKLHD